MPDNKVEATKPVQVNLRDVALENPQGVPSVYSNNALMNSSHADVRLMFAEVIVEPNNKVRQELRANVVMSRDQALLLLEMLKRNLPSEKAEPAAQKKSQ